MPARATTTDGKGTRERILDASRRLFNEQGYARTTLAQIAAEVGIAEGNLWYHFRTKRDLVAALEAQVRKTSKELLSAYPSGGPLADDYVEVVLASMKQRFEHRFLLRDVREFSRRRQPIRRDPDMAASFAGLLDLLRRMKKEGMLRREPPVDLATLARSLFIVSRYWTDHLEEHEGLEVIGWEDQERGFRQHLAVLSPYLTSPARRALEAAAAAASLRFAEGGA